MFPWIPKRSERIFLLGAGLTLLYGLTAWGCLQFTFFKNVSPFWPPAGVAFAFIWLYGLRFVPAIFLGSLLANLVTSLTGEALLDPDFLLRAVTAGLGDAAMPLLGILALKRFVGHRLPFARLKDLGVFFTFSVFGATAIGALIGISPELFQGSSDPLFIGRLWATWWLGDSVAVAILAPFLLLWILRKPDWGGAEIRQALLLIGISVLISGLVFFWEHPLDAPEHPFVFLAIPLVVWGALALGNHGSTLFLLSLYLGLTVHLLWEAESMRIDFVQERVVVLQALFVIIAGLGLALGAQREMSLLSRAQTDRALRHALSLNRRLGREMGERERVEEERRRLEVQIERAAKLESLGIQAGRLAMDFDTVFDLLEAQIEDLALPEIRDEYLRSRLEGLCAGIRHGQDLVHRILADSGRVRLRTEAVRAGDLLDDLGRIFGRISRKDQDFECRIEEGIPEVRCDPLRLRQVVLNLFRQGQELLEDARGRIGFSVQRVEGSPRDPGNLVLLEEEGSGPFLEIAVEVVAEKGELLQEKNRDREEVLSSIFAIVQAHGGGFCQSSLSPDREVLKVLLPVAREEKGGDGTREKKDARIRILFVDDDALLRDLVRRVLRPYDLDLVECASAEEGIERLEKEGGFDVLLLDLALPGRPGTAVLDECACRGLQVPVVITTGLEEIELRRILKEYGAFVSLLPKPFRARELRKVLEAALRRGLPKKREVLSREAGPEPSGPCPSP